MAYRQTNPDLLTVALVAELLFVSHDTVRRLCDRGSLACVRTRGGQRRIPRAAAEALRDGRPYRPVAA